MGVEVENDESIKNTTLEKDTNCANTKVEGFTKYGAVRERRAVFCPILVRNLSKDLGV